MLFHLRDLGAGLSSFTERWVPDAWVICMILTLIAIFLCIFGVGTSLEDTILAWGDGVWSLLGLGMQFTIAMVAAHACVSSKPIYKLFSWLSSIPNKKEPVQALILAGVFSLVTGYLNWALCLVACALFTPFMLKNNPKVDVRLLICASYLGLGTVWHGGLSGSAPLILATPENPLLMANSEGVSIVDRLYPVTETLFNKFNLVFLVIIGTTGLLLTCMLHPKKNARILTEDEIKNIIPKPPKELTQASRPADFIDRFRGWILLAIVLLAYPLGHSIINQGFGTSWTINAYNITFLVIALILHGNAPSFLTAVREGVTSAWGIIIQFPFYAGIFGLLQKTDLGDWLGNLFATISTTSTYPWVVYTYSGFMNLFVPSAGAKWMIEAPFLIPAGEQLDVSVITTLLAYAYGDSTSNLIQPFFAIPILAVTRMRFGDVVGYTFIVAAACFLVCSLAMFIIPANL